MLSRPYDAPRSAACEELNVRTVHRGRHWRVTEFSVLLQLLYGVQKMSILWRGLSFQSNLICVRKHRHCAKSNGLSSKITSDQRLSVAESGFCCNGDDPVRQTGMPAVSSFHRRRWDVVCCWWLDHVLMGVLLVTRPPIDGCAVGD
jgi:hypothetical protein